MKNLSTFSPNAFRRTLVSVALLAAYTSSWALPTFTFSPSAVGLTGANVTADNVIVSDFANVTLNSPTTFSEQGYLSLTGFQLGGSNVVAGGLPAPTACTSSTAAPAT